MSAALEHPLAEYVVLGVYEGEWTIAGTVNARGAAAAVKLVVEKKDELPPRIRNTDVFVAVPSRSWKPVKVTPKVETRLVLEDAS